VVSIGIDFQVVYTISTQDIYSICQIHLSFVWEETGLLYLVIKITQNLNV